MKKTLRVIFDLDDTLYPERAFAQSGFRAAAAWASSEWGIDNMAAEMSKLLDSGHLGAVFKMALARQRPNYSDEDLARLIDVYRNHEPTIALYEDAPAALANSARYGPLGLITDGTHWVQKSKVEALGIAPHFKHIVYTGALGGRDFHKPHPLAFELMEAELAAPDALFVYIGDNPAKDFVAPNARGWGTVQVVRPNGIHDAQAEVEGGAPQHVIESLDDLDQVLETFSQQA